MRSIAIFLNTPFRISLLLSPPLSVLGLRLKIAAVINPQIKSINININSVFSSSLTEPYRPVTKAVHEKPTADVINVFSLIINQLLFFLYYL